MTSKLILLAKFICIITVITSIHDVRACEDILRILPIYKEIGCKHVNLLVNDNCTGKYVKMIIISDLVHPQKN